jgi:hypothetical protein
MGVFFLFFFNFVMWPQWQSSTREMSQIWLQVREESRIFLESSYILAICKNPLSKYDYFRIFFRQSCYFFIKNPLRSVTRDFSWSPQCEKGQKKLVRVLMKINKVWIVRTDCGPVEWGHSLGLRKDEALSNK